MHAGIEKSSDTQAASEADQLGRVRQLSQGRDRQRQTQQAQSPVTAGAAERFRRIGTKRIIEHRPHHPSERQSQHALEQQFTSRQYQKLSHGHVNPRIPLINKAVSF